MPPPSRLPPTSGPGGTGPTRAAGRRIEKDVSGTITRYVYDGDNIALEYNAANVLQARYSHGDQVDQPLVQDRSGAS